MKKNEKKLSGVIVDGEVGKSNFKLWKWLPNYLRWFFYGFTHQ